MERVRGIPAVPALAQSMEGFIREAGPPSAGGGGRNEWNVSVPENRRITFEELAGAITRVNPEHRH